MPTILDFCIRPQDSNTFRLEVFARNPAQLQTQPLATAMFEYRLSFLTDFEQSTLDFDPKTPDERFDRLQKFGWELFRKLFNDDVRHVWAEHKQNSDFLALCLRIAPEASELEALPWETLHDGEEFIAAGAKTGMSRLPLDVAPQGNLPTVPSPIRMLSLISSPLDLRDDARLNVEREQEILLEAINTPAGRGRLQVDFEDEAKLEILANSLDAGYHILHFTGHGIAPSKNESGRLLMEDRNGKSYHASPNEFLQALEKGIDSLRLVVLSGCQTSGTRYVAGFRDFTRDLIRTRIPAVVGMQFSISDQAGLLFAERFYQCLIEGIQIEKAVSTARRALLDHQSFSISADAFAPVLFASNGHCLQAEESKVKQPAQQPAGDSNFHLSLPQLSLGFYGRRREYRQIRDALLHQNHRAVIIHGIGGIGKTALVSYTADRLYHRHQCFKGVYVFECSSGTLTPERIVLELHRHLEQLGEKGVEKLLHQSLPPETLASGLAQAISRCPLLAIFDNFESQLERVGDRFRIADEALRHFVIALLKATNTGSRFLFTSRCLFEIDDELPIHHLPLKDLSRPEALNFMLKLPNLANSLYWDKQAAFEAFGGHPYALVALDRHCRFSSLREVLRDADSVGAELHEFLAIELNYARLSPGGHELLNRLAAFRKPVPREAAEWVVREESDGAKDLNQLIAELTDWGLLTPIKEDGQSKSLAVHSLVRDFCREKQKGDAWRARLRDAANFYINLTEQSEKTPAAVWDGMEAFELMMESEDFETSAAILVKAHPVLARWASAGYLEKRYRSLLDKTAPPVAAKIRHGLGICLQYQSKYHEAMEQFRQSLQIKQQLEDRSGAAKSIHQIGNLHTLRGEYDEALKMFEQSREIDEALDNRPGLAISLHQLGTIHYVRNEYEAALKDYQQSLKIKEELGDREGMATTLHQIGMVHEDRGDYETALEKYQRSLEIKEALDDRAGIAKTLHQIGNIYYFRSEYEAALEHYQRSLKIKEDLNDRPGLAKSLHQIGNLYYLRSEYEAAIEQFQRALKVSEEIGDRAGAANALQNIAAIHQSRNEFDQAVEQYRQLLEIEEELGNRVAVAKLLDSLGTIDEYRGNYDEAINHFERSLKIVEELGDIAGVARSLHGIGRIHEHRGDNKIALEHYQRALDIREKLGNSAGVAAILHSIGMILEDQGEYEAAMMNYRRSIEIKERLGNRAGVAQTLHQIGNVHYLRGEFDMAMEHYERALKIAEDVNDLLAVARLLHNIGTIHESAGDHETALKCYQRSLEIKKITGERVGQAQTLSQMVGLFTDEGRYPEAFHHMFSALRTIADPQFQNTGISLEVFRDLRARWGEEHFDAAWREATGEDVPGELR